MEENNSTKSTSIKKPKWLKVLEKQSWQAELIVSGLAIFGSLQLPSLIGGLEKIAFYECPEKLLDIMPIIFIIFYIIAQSLIIGFLVHFILRAFWIGMLGLVSAYPNGINWDFKTYLSPHFLSKLREDLPDVSVFNKKLDDFCSIIFSLASLLGILYLPIMIFGMLVLGIALLINWVIPDVGYIKIAIILSAIFLTPSLLTNFFHHKKLREKAWVKKIQFPFYKFSTKLFLNVFYLPFHYISYIFNSNVGQYKFGIYFFIPVFLMLGTLSITIKGSKLHLFSFDRFLIHQNSLTRWDNNQFEENLNGETPIGITIPSYEINSDYIRLFIPKMKRENASVESICNEIYERDDDLNRMQNDSLQWAWTKDCLLKYYQIYINETRQTDLEFLWYNIPNTFATGYITFLSTEDCKQGKNEIRVVTGYKEKDNEQQKEFRVPFFKN